jgi:group I intron endonuclease
MTCGVYSITNKNNGEIYIGSSIDIEHRWREHVRMLEKGDHCNRLLQRAWSKYGETAFVFAILILCCSDELVDMEQCYLDHIKPQYNLCSIAGSSLGVKHSDETRAKVSAALRGRIVSPETRAKRSAARRGRIASFETRAKIGAANRGHIASPETRAKMSAAHRGHTMSSEIRAKLSTANRGHIVSDATRKKLSAAAKGNQNAKGHHLSVLARQKLSTAHKKKQFLIKLEGLPKNV